MFAQTQSENNMYIGQQSAPPHADDINSKEDSLSVKGCPPANAFFTCVTLTLT